MAELLKILETSLYVVIAIVGLAIGLLLTKVIVRERRMKKKLKQMKSVYHKRTSAK